VTAFAFVASRLRRKKAGSCGSGCGCGSEKKPKFPMAGH